MKAPTPQFKLLSVLRPPGKRGPQQADDYCRRCATCLLLYNNVHYGEPRLHYEIAPVSGRRGWEVGFHCETRDKHLNRVLLDGFRHHLFEIKDELGESMEAEMWDRGWTKIYEVIPDAPTTAVFQAQIAQRLADIIICLHPIYVDLRNSIAQIHR